MFNPTSHLARCNSKVPRHLNCCHLTGHSWSRHSYPPSYFVINLIAYFSAFVKSLSKIFCDRPIKFKRDEAFFWSFHLVPSSSVLQFGLEVGLQPSFTPLIIYFVPVLSGCRSMQLVFSCLLARSSPLGYSSMLARSLLMGFSLSGSLMLYGSLLSFGLSIISHGSINDLCSNISIA